MSKIKILSFLFVSLFMFTLTSCEDDEANKSAVVKVTVLKSQAPQKQITVCLFDSYAGPSTSFYSPFHAKKKVITDDNGVATFDLSDFGDLKLMSSQTTFYFAVFDDSDNVLGQSAVTIKDGETKELTIIL